MASAYLGQPPATQRDSYIRIGVEALKGSIFFPNGQLPSGVQKPSIDSPDDWNGGGIEGAAVTFLALIVLITSGRFYIRLVIKRVPIGLDDLFVIPCAIAGIAYLSSLIWLVLSPRSCMGRHIYFCTYEQFNGMVMQIEIFQAIFFLAVYCAKVSLLFLNRRITGLSSGIWNTAQNVLLVLIVIFGLFSFFITAFPCSPVPAHYSLAVLGSMSPSQIHCIPGPAQAQIQWATRAMHIITDLMLLSIPIMTLWKLQMPRYKKIGLCILFGFGLVSVIASILRCVIVASSPLDLTFGFTPIAVWDMLDLSSAVMLASLPVYYPVLDGVFRRAGNLMSTTRANGRSSDRQEERSGPAAKSRYGKRSTPLGSKSNWLELGPKGDDGSLAGLNNSILRTDEFEAYETQELPRGSPRQA